MAALHDKNKHEEIMLPEAVSLFLACKGVALIEDI